MNGRSSAQGFTARTTAVPGSAQGFAARTTAVPSSAQGFTARTTAAPGSVAVPVRSTRRRLADGGVAGLARGAAILSVSAAPAAGNLVERARHPLAAVHALRGGTGDMEVAL